MPIQGEYDYDQGSRNYRKYLRSRTQRRWFVAGTVFLALHGLYFNEAWPAVATVDLFAVAFGIFLGIVYWINQGDDDGHEDNNPGGYW